MGYCRYILFLRKLELCHDIAILIFSLAYGSLSM
jgi:hypothetical protein